MGWLRSSALGPHEPSRDATFCGIRDDFPAYKKQKKPTKGITRRAFFTSSGVFPRLCNSWRHDALYIEKRSHQRWAAVLKVSKRVSLY